MHQLLAVLVAGFVSAGGFATEPKETPPAKAATKAEKRGKKTTICPTCGKPESKCDCEGEDKHGEHEKAEKSEAKTK